MISARERRVILIGAATLTVAVLLTRIVPAILRLSDTITERAAGASTLLASARAAITSDPLVRDSLAQAARTLVAASPRLFEGTSQATAFAELSSLVSRLAESRGLLVIRQTSLPDSAASTGAPFRELRLRIDVEGDTQGVVGWIAALEEGEKLIRIQAISIASAEIVSSASQAERLRADVVLGALATRPMAQP